MFASSLPLVTGYCGYWMLGKTGARRSAHGSRLKKKGMSAAAGRKRPVKSKKKH